MTTGRERTMMKLLAGVFGTLFLATLIGSTGACSKGAAAARPVIEAGPESAPMSPGEVDEALHEGKKLVLIDVREPEEFADGRVAVARNIPLRDLRARLADIPRDADVVLVCRTGARSQMAWELLLELGYTKVHNMDGGMLAWQGEIAR